MARRRAEGGTFSFDLEPDELDEDDVTFGDFPVEPSRLQRAAGAVRARVRSWPRRRVVAIAAVVGVGLVGTLGTVTLTAAARQRAWVKTTATVPGAVRDLGHEPVEAWRLPIVTPTALGLVGDVLVVRSGDWGSADGPALYGVDLERSEVVWTATPPDAMECTVGPGDAYLQALAPRVARGDVVVCLSADRREVAVIDADGTTVAQRDIADAGPRPSQDLLDTGVEWAAHRVYGTADGDLVRFDRLGPAIEAPAVDPAEVTDATDAEAVYAGMAVTLRDPLELPAYRVRREDAATGEVRWETELQPDELPAGAQVDQMSGCLTTDASGALAFAPDSSAMDTIDSRTVVTDMCGIDAVLDLGSGEVLQRHPAFGSGSSMGGLQALPLGDDRYAEVEQTATASADGIPITMHVKRDDGTPVGDVPGYGLPPMATDGPGSALIVAITRDAEAMAAYDADDAHLVWRSTAVQMGRAIVRTADVVVVTDGTKVVGLDWQTGKTLWTHHLYDDAATAGMGWYAVIDAVTDGRRVAVTVPSSASDYADPTSGVKTTVALDLASGEALWTTEGSVAAPQPIAGRLYRFDSDAIVALE